MSKLILNFPTFHSHPDSLDTGSKVEAFAEREVELGTGYFTVTDHGVLQATRKIYDLCHSKKYEGKLTPILGCEGYFYDPIDPVLAKFGASTPAAVEAYWKGDAKKPKYGHVTLHCQDEAAYFAMCRILSDADANVETRAHGGDRKPIFGWAQLEELAGYKVTVGSGCLIGMVSRHLLDHQRPDICEGYYQRLRAMFGDRFHAEMFPHKCDRDWVSEVSITLEDGTTIKVGMAKKLKTDKDPAKGDRWDARDLAASWNRSKTGHGKLRAIMESAKWVEQENPKDIVDIQVREGFVMNECSPWSPNGDVQLGANKLVLELATKYGDKIVCSDDSHLAVAADKVAQDVRLGQHGTWRMSTSYHRFTSEEARQHFASTLGISDDVFASWVDNNRGWAQGFNDFKFTPRQALPAKFYPENTLKHLWSLIRKHGRYQNTPAYNDRIQAELNLLHWNGSIDLLPYFFIDEEVVSLYESKGQITGPGRGSAAGLLLTYLLGITHVDPLRYGLSMDRFMTPDRIASGKLPDIDQDLHSRDLLVDPEDDTKGWLRERFGDCCMQISTDTTLKLRTAVKDVARWSRSKAEEGLGGFVPPEIEVLTKKFMDAPQGVTDSDFVFGYNKEGEDVWVPGSIESDVALQKYIADYPGEWESVKKALGLTRSKGRHPCGYVLASEPIKNFIPLTSVKGVTVTQFDSKSVEAAGGLKMDFLVVKVLKYLNDAVQLVQARHGSPGKDLVIGGRRVPAIRALPFQGTYADIWDLPEDQQVFQDICKGKTETVFQFDTGGARKWLRQFGAKGLRSIEDLAAFTALDRPGGLDAFVAKPGCAGGFSVGGSLTEGTVSDQTAVGGVHGRPGGPSSGRTGGDANRHNMMVEYAHRVRGEERSSSLPPVFDRLLPETHGIMVYQEQMQYMYQYLTGCSGAEAEDFRAAVAKKKMTTVQKAYSGFIERAAAKVGADVAKDCWAFFISWSAYGFNRSHAVCYSIIGYACAWLKHHYPLEWWTAVLRNVDRSKICEEFWPYCGPLVKTPDINLSQASFSVEGDGIRAPISLLQGIGEGAQKELAAGLPYKDIHDFCAKIAAKKAIKRRNKDGKELAGLSTLNSGVVKKLICSGVMDSLFPAGMDIPEQMTSYEEAFAATHGKKRAKPADPRYCGLKPLQRYQLKKSILAPHGSDLREMVVASKRTGMKQLPAGGYDMSWVNPRDNGAERVGVVDAVWNRRLQEIEIFNGTIRWAVAAYVISERRFTYKGGTATAVDLLLDIQGSQQKFIKWPDKESGELPKGFPEDLTGAVVVAIVNRWKADSPATIDDVAVVQPPLVLTEEKEDTDEEPSADSGRAKVKSGNSGNKPGRRATPK